MDFIGIEKEKYPPCAILNRDMNIQSVNQSWTELTGYYPEAVSGQSLLSVVEDTTGLGFRFNLKAEPDKIHALPMGLKQNPAEFLTDTIAVALTLHPVYSTTEEVSGYLAVAIPVDDKQTMSHLGGVWLDPSDFVSHLVRGTSHKLNNLVTVFNGYTDLLMMMHPGESELQEGLQQIASAAEGLVEMITRLQDLGNQSSLDLLPVLAVEILEELRLQLPKYSREKVQFKIETSTLTGIVQVDSRRLTEAIFELVRNGADSIEGSGSVSIQFHQTPDHLWITIKDTGCGLSEEAQNQIFQPYYTTKKEQRRLGLGLNAVIGVLNQMKATLTVTSQPGIGSEFVIQIPLLQS